MNLTAGQTLRVILYEGAGSDPLPDADRCELLRGLLEKGYPVSCVREAGSRPRAARADLLVIGRFHEQKPASARDAETGVEVHFRDVGNVRPPGILMLVDQLRQASNIPEPGKWKPWFPVIDFSRCTNCMQCLSFCLFDVYGVSPEGKIQVQNQSNCKTDCPACSRVCPEVAILFPKYRHGPIHGGEVNSDDVRREAMKVDISALLGGDIYAALRDRSAKAKSRFSKERDEERALKERLTCLNKLQQEMDIPAEVLAALPGADEIRARSEAAKNRAQAAMRNTNSSSQIV